MVLQEPKSASWRTIVTPEAKGISPNDSPLPLLFFLKILTHSIKVPVLNISGINSNCWLHDRFEYMHPGLVDYLFVQQMHSV